jgi:integrase
MKIAWNHVDGIGESKKSNRNESTYIGENGHKVSDKIHALKTKDQFMRLGTSLLTHQKEHFNKRADLHNLSREIVESFVNDMIERGLKYNSISTYLSQLNKLSIAIGKIRDTEEQWRKDKRDPLFTPQDIKELRAKAKKEALGSKHVNRAYTNPDAIGVHMKGKSAISFELQKEYGLRVTAATKINAKQLKGNNRFEFVNKGGKQQTITLNPLLYKKLEKSVKNGKDGHLVAYNTYLRDFKHAVKLSGQKYTGTHGLRYTFAQRKLQELRKEGLSDEQAKWMISKMMGHKRKSITEYYLQSTDM